MALPDSARFVVIGAGVHGLSTAYHLAKELESAGTGWGGDVVVLDKNGIGAGASGIACGVVRNNYYQPAMRRLMAHSVGVWEDHAERLSYHSVGYMQISPEVMHEQVATIYEQEQAIGYPSTFIEGEAACREYMLAMFPDWRAKNITSVLHEARGGYANNMASMTGLAAMARAEGVRIFTGTKVTGLRRDGSGSVTHVETDQGTIACEQVAVGAGPWVRDFWKMLDLPDTVTVVGRDGNRYERPMWVYWCLEEGTLGVDPDYLSLPDGRMPPVIHVDTDAPLYDDDGGLVTEQLWGIYFKPDTNFGGVQGGAMPYIVDKPLDQVAVDPYGTSSPDFIVGDDFKRMWTSALSHCLGRFEGLSHLYKDEPSGGLGCFTPDSFPVIDHVADNAYVIADSNHGYKMLGVGQLVAKTMLGSPQDILHPFRFARYAEGDLHPTSNSPFPWS